MKILIDARLFGPEHTGTGRYTMNLVNSLAKIDRKNEYLILLRKDKLKSINLPKNWTKIEADFKHYSFSEQINLPRLISKLKPDLVHFPHFNVPVLYFGDYVVTIHDMIMHRFRGKDSTTRAFPIYFIWRLGYHLSFAKAVYGAKRVIVPSYAVKNELLGYYHIGKDKVSVTYESAQL